MRNALVAICALAAPVMAFGGPWQTSYEAALKQAKAQDKPIFVYFNNVPAAQADAKFKGQETVADKFVRVYADKNTPNGKELFKLFEINGDQAAVVVERDQAWQFARAERDLSSAELASLLQSSTNAKGVPSSSVIQSNYFSPESAEPVSSTSAVTPATTGSTTIQSYCPSCRRR